jgi:hypothetical protein
MFVAFMHGVTPAYREQFAFCYVQSCDGMTGAAFVATEILNQDWGLCSKLYPVCFHPELNSLSYYSSKVFSLKSEQ